MRKNQLAALEKVPATHTQTVEEHHSHDDVAEAGDENQHARPMRLMQLPLTQSAQSTLGQKEEVDVIALRTRAALKRNVLGDVSNIQSAQIPVLPSSKLLRPRGRATKKETVGTGAADAVAASVHTGGETKVWENKAPPAAVGTNVDSMEMTLVGPAIQDELKHIHNESQLAQPGQMTSVKPTAPVWDDLDAEDTGDPSMVTEYVQDIFAYLRDLEIKLMPDPRYMSRQGEVTWKMRSVLVDWLVEIHWKLKLLPETLFLSVNLMDRFLSMRAVSLAKFQLVGVAATLIASKYEEVLSPSVSNLVYLSDGSYDDQEILKAECYMLNSLQFNLSYPSPYVFLRRISKADNYDIQTRTLAKYFLESALLDPCFLPYPPSIMAAAGVFLARKMLNRGDWPANLIHYSGYAPSSLYPVVQLMIGFFRKASKYEAIYKKYSSKKFMKASIFVKDYITKYYSTPANSTTAITQP